MTCQLAACLICAVNAWAGDEAAGATDLKKLTLEELMNIEVQTVSVASKHRQKVTEAPSSVTIITADDIRQYGYRTLADVLKSVRGFYVTYDRNYSYVGVRGFGRPGDYNTRILLMVDGHPINDNIYDTAAVGYEFVLDVDLIDRIEISRGPGSSLYGSNAFFGVINVVSKDGHNVGGVEGSAEAGRYDSVAGRVTYGGLYPRGTDVLVSGTAGNSPGRNLYFPEFDPANPNADPRAANGGVAVGADYEKFRSSFAKVTTGDFIIEGGYVRREKGIPTGAFNTVFNDPDTRTVDGHYFADLRYGHSLSGHSDVSVRVGYDEYWYTGDYVQAGPPVVTNRDETVGRWWSGDVKYSTAVGESQTLTLGAAFKANTAQDQSNFNVDPYEVSLDDRRRSDLWAVYGQDEVRFSPSLILNAGVRYDHYDTFGGTTNPRAGLLYYPAVNSAVKFLAGRAFRAPNAYELYYNDGYSTSEPNPDLKPETIETYEAVYEYYFGNRLWATISAYRYVIYNLISLETDPANGLLVYRNVDAADANGVEFEVQGKSTRGLRGTFSTAFQKTVDRQTHERLTNSPENMTKLNLSVPVASDHVFASIEEQYMSRRKTLAGNTSEFFVTNLTLSAREIVKGLDLSVSVYNLLDKRYRDPASEEHGPFLDTIQQDGLMYRLKVSYLY